jgi:hypothetical protein
MHVCCILWPSHPLWPDHSDCIWQGVQIMNFLIMQLSPASKYLFPKYLSFATFSKGSVSYLCVMIYSAFEWQDINIYLVFSVFTSVPTYLLASVRGTVFLFIVFMLSPDRFLSSSWTRSWYVPFSSSLIWFSWTRVIWSLLHYHHTKCWDIWLWTRQPEFNSWQG